MRDLTRRGLLQGVAALGALAGAGGRVRPAGAADPLKVGVIYVSPIADVGWTRQHALAVAAMEQALGDRVAVTQIENVAQPQDAERVLRELARSGHGLLFGTSFSHGTPLQKVAQQFPKTVFEHCSGIKQLPNLGTFEARYYEGTYVAGIAAGKLTRTGKLGFVAGYPVPDVVCAANALLLGARSVNPAATCSTVFLNSWYDPAKEKDSASILTAQGCDVIASMTDTPATAQEAAAKGAWSIGYASDLARYAPERLITSFVLDWSGIYTGAARDALAGTWTAKDRWQGFKEGTVKMAPYAKTVPAEVVALAEAAETAIKAGTRHPWQGEIRDRGGQVRIPAGVTPPDAELRTMNWFVEGMTGELG